MATIHDPEEGRKLNVAVLPERENDRAEIYFKSRIEQVGYNFSDLLEELFAHLDESGAKRRNLAFTYTSISVTEPKLKKTVEKTWQSATCPNALKRFQRKLGHYYSRRTKQEFLIEVLAEGADALAIPLKAAAKVGLSAVPLHGLVKYPLKAIPAIIAKLVKIGFMIAKEQDNKGFKKGTDEHDLHREIKESHRVVSTEYGLEDEDLLDFSPGSSEAPSQLNPILMHSRIRRVRSTSRTTTRDSRVMRLRA